MKCPKKVWKIVELYCVFCFMQKDELYLLLSDTTTDEDIHINDALVEAGLACFARTLQEQDQPLQSSVNLALYFFVQLENWLSNQPTQRK